MCRKSKILLSLVSLFIAQLVILLFSFHWLVKYYQDTLIAEFDFYQVFISLGRFGVISLCFSIFIIAIIIYQLFYKKNRIRSVFYLNTLFIVSLVFFILQRLYELFFMPYNLLIVLNTLVWTDMFYLASLSFVGIILSIMILFTAESADVEKL